jgi:NaMN:DMB phosphoribosyltransferase
LLFTRKKAISVKQADLRDMFKKASRSACLSTIVVPHNLLSLIPLMSSALKTPENTEENPDKPKSADEGDIKMECSPD